MQKMTNDKDQQMNTAAIKRDQGFTILELIISMVIFTIVTGAVFGVLQIARKTRTVVTQNTGLNKTVRLALNLMGRDTYNAGFGYPLAPTTVGLPDNRISTLLTIPNDVDTLRDTVPPIIASNDLTPNTFNLTAGTTTDQISFLFKDPTFNLVGIAPDQVSQPLNVFGATTGTGFSQIVPVSGSNLACRVNDLLLVSGSNGSTLAQATSLVAPDKIRFANSDDLGINQAGSVDSVEGITTPASIQRVKMITYRVSTDGILMRREYGNAPPVTPAVAYIDEPLVYGVETFQITYVMDDGTTANNPANLAAVRQVRYTIGVRSTELDPSGQPFRVQMTSTFGTRNLGYDAN